MLVGATATLLGLRLFDWHRATVHEDVAKPHLLVEQISLGDDHVGNLAAFDRTETIGSAGLRPFTGVAPTAHFNWIRFSRR